MELVLRGTDLYSEQRPVAHCPHIEGDSDGGIHCDTGGGSRSGCVERGGSGNRIQNNTVRIGNYIHTADYVYLSLPAEAFCKGRYGRFCEGLT